MKRNMDQPYDFELNKVRVLKSRCATCIFWPDSRSVLSSAPDCEERTAEVIKRNVRAEALLTCHSTLRDAEYPDFGPAVCNGYWAEHRDVVAGRVAQHVIGIIKIDPPTDKDE